MHFSETRPDISAGAQNVGPQPFMPAFVFNEPAPFVEHGNGEPNLSLAETTAHAAQGFLADKCADAKRSTEGMMSLSPVAFNGLTTFPFKYDLPGNPKDMWGRERSKGVIVVDLNESNQPVGFGEVSAPTSSEDTEFQPYVMYTETLEGFRHKGYGIRRLVAMNEVAKREYGAVLHSDPNGDTEPEAAKSWEYLVGRGRAETYDKDGKLFYRFLS